MSDAAIKCPKCSETMQVENYQGVEVDRCAGCSGIWLDHEELDQLEDAAFADDEAKGTVITRERPSELKCPHCNALMSAFRYRYHDLILDYCKAKHGWWLDAGEEKRVLEIMKQRGKDLKRSARALKSWGNFLNSLRSK